LQTYGAYYTKSCHAEYPAGSGNIINLNDAAHEISRRLISIFKKDANGNRPVNDGISRYQNDPYFKDLVLFYEYFHGDTARGVGASHQTGWTGVVAELINRAAAFEKSIFKS
jgi:hypothetical protein